MENFINIRKLNLDELAGVVNLYPWYGAARKELCVRMSKIGADAWGKNRYGDAAMYVGDRRIISDIYRTDIHEDYSDKDLEELLKFYIHDEKEEKERAVHVVGGDYFTQAQYDNVRRSEDNVFSRFAFKARLEASNADPTEGFDDRFCTETLAQIYEDQGYCEQAKRIYSRLLLKFPEKNAYFAALIEKLDKEIKNKT